MFLLPQPGHTGLQEPVTHSHLCCGPHPCNEGTAKGRQVLEADVVFGWLSLGNSSYNFQVNFPGLLVSGKKSLIVWIAPCLFDRGKRLLLFIPLGRHPFIHKKIYTYLISSTFMSLSSPELLTWDSGMGLKGLIIH